jgi:flagellar L-ring protein precursor FlgH
MPTNASSFEPMILARRLVVSAALVTSLSACNMFDRISEVGSEPSLRPIENPAEKPGMSTVQMPMPAPETPLHLANSLWRPGSRAFFKDQRAARVGDLLTVVVNMDEKAEISNETKRSRSNSENVDLNGFLGYQGSLNRILPQALTSGTDIVDLGSASSNSGLGSVDREESITFQVAAVVTQVLPNGNLVIYGHQETRVNFEVRELTVAGVVRPEDISSSNTIQHTQIAEARFAYGGRGQLTDVQQPRYGHQVLDIFLPF